MNPSRAREGQVQNCNKGITPSARLLEHLDGVRPNGANRWTARCPAHEDRSSSLSIREADDGRVLLHCFAACSTIDVLAAVGLMLRDLYPARSTAYRPSSAPPRAPGIEAAMPGDLPGELLAYRALGLPIDLEGAQFGAGNLEALAFWIADALTPTLAPTKNTTSENTVQHTSRLAPHQNPLRVGVLVQEFDPLAKYQRKIDRLTRGIR